MKRKKWIVKYLSEFIIIVLGITVSFWVNQLSINAQNNQERIKVLNSLKKEADEIYEYCQERKLNWNQDILILNSLLDDKSSIIKSENINKSRIQFNLIYYRVFEPPTDRYHSIINSGHLKYIRSDKIKELISKLHITYSTYVQTNIQHEKELREDLLKLILNTHPNFILDKFNQNISFKEYYNTLNTAVSEDDKLQASLILLRDYQKNRTKWLELYLALVEDLNNEIEVVLNIN
tara:strand:+ start:65 stop:769 length:705 start_codon:yes stop_codon:yes gene_type:complete